MDDYLPHQIYEWPTNEWEEEYQGGDDLPKVDYTDEIHEDGNDDSYDGFVGSEVQLTDGSGNPWLVKLLKLSKVINVDIIVCYNTNPFLNTPKYKGGSSDSSYNELATNQICGSDVIINQRKG